jgi:hypothetical protein
MALIPAENLVDWIPGESIGVLGGIPTNRTEYVNLVTEGVDNTGATDVTTAIQGFLDSCPSGQYVYAPAGTYRVDGILNFGVGNSNISLVGDGETTIIDGRNASYTIYIGTGDTFGPPFGQSISDVTVSAGLAKESTSLTIPDTTGFATGQIVMIAVENDPDLPMMSVAGYDYVTGQMAVITGTTGTTISFSPPLYSDYGGGTLGARCYTTQNGFVVSFVGIENLLIDLDGQEGIKIEGAHDCWTKNVRIKNFINYGITMQSCSRMEIRRTRIELRAGGGTNGSGILVNAVGGFLIEDNIIDDVQPPLEINQNSSGGVFAYNYATGAVGVDINHGHCPQFVLCEGNWGSTFIQDGYFGTAAYHTWYRNVSVSTVSLKRFTRNFALAGNIFPTAIQFGLPNIGNTSFTGEADYPSDPWADYGMTGTLTTRTSDSVGVVTLSSIGQITNGFQGVTLLWNGGDNRRNSVQVNGVSGNQITIGDWAGVTTGDVLPAADTAFTVFTGSGGYQEKDLVVESSTTLKGNYYEDSETTDPLDGDVLVDSLFHDAKPSYFQSLGWPPYDPESPAGASAEDIPAGYRFVNGVDPPAGGGTTTITVANVTNFNIL